MAVYMEGRLTKLYLLLRYLIFRYFVLNIGASKSDEADLGAIPSAMDCWESAGWCVVAGRGGFVRFQPTVFLGFTGGADPAIRWLFWALAFYFVGGGWLFWRVNQRYAEKLKQLVAGFQSAGFQPQLEVFAKINDAYLGIDGSARRLLAYPVKGAEHFFRFDEINAWRIVPVGKHNHRLEVLTSNLDVPVFSLVLRPTEVLNTEARLDTLLGT